MRHRKRLTRHYLGRVQTKHGVGELVLIEHKHKLKRHHKRRRR